MAVIGPRFTLKGFDPPGLRSTPLAQQRAFWAAVSQYVAEAKEAELRAGLDRFGEPMAGLSARTIRDRRSEMGRADPHAPPLQPAHGLSRTRALFVAQPTARLDGITCFWSLDRHTGASWGEILRHHKAGDRHLPVRDVIGLSPLSLATVKQRAQAWWAVYNDLTASMIGRKPVESEPAPAFTYSRVPPYVPKAPENAVPKQKQRVSSLDVDGKHYVFQSGSAAQVKDAIGGGKFSGFHSHAEVKAEAARLGTTHDAKGRAVFSFGSKGPPIPAEPRPTPRPAAPAPAPPAPIMTRREAEAELGIKFTPAPVAKRNPAYTTVVVDVARVDADLALDPGYHVGPGGSGAGIAGRYEQFKRFLSRAKAAGTPIEQPRATIATDTGRVALGDGRHRFAVLRDLGARIIPVSVRRSVARTMRRLYGARPDE